MGRSRGPVRATFGLMLLLATLVCLEALLRVSGRYRTFYEEFSGEYLSHYQPSDGGWYRTHPPHIRDTTVTSEYSYPKNTNALGLRDADHPVQKDSAEFRFISLGDSFTECWGAPEDSTWTRLLAGYLGQGMDRPVRGMLAGVSGSDPFFGYVMLRDKLLEYRPDWVLYALNYSDIDDVVVRGGMERFRPGGTVAFRQAPAIERWYRRSHVVRMVAHELFGYNYLLLRPRRMEALRRESAGLVAEALDSLNALCRQNGIAFTAVIHPLYNELEAQTYTSHLDSLLGRLKASGFPLCDLMPWFIGEYAMHERVLDFYWEYDAHFNSRGYDAFAHGVAGCARAAHPRWFPPRDGTGSDTLENLSTP